MPKPYIDKHSGAIIFQSTPEELKIQGLEKRISELETTVARLEKLLKKRRW